MAGFVLCAIDPPTPSSEQIMTRTQVIHDYTMIAIAMPITEGLKIKKNTKIIKLYQP